jgi:hypothetical protein
MDPSSAIAVKDADTVLELQGIMTSGVCRTTESFSRNLLTLWVRSAILSPFEFP